MKLLLSLLSVFGLSLSYPVFILAHETSEVHEEQPASIDPAVAVMLIFVIIVLGFLLWKFILRKKEIPPVQPK